MLYPYCTSLAGCIGHRLPYLPPGRPGRLTDGPYTSYDLNTLLKATAGDRKGVQLVLSDRLAAETSRISLAGGLGRQVRGCSWC